MLSSTEAVPLAILQDAWHAHPSRAHQHIACVQGVAHVWEEWHVPRNACGMRDWHRQKDVLASSVLVTTAQQLTGPGIVRHSEARPEIAHDYEQRKSGGWQRKKLSATRYSAIVFSLATVVLSDSRYQLFANTQAGM